MTRPFQISQSRSVRIRSISCIYSNFALLAAVTGLLGLTLSGTLARAQAITINTHTGNVSSESGTVDRRFAQVTPTNVPLGKGELDAKSRQEVIRVLQAEQGFAMRPFPMGHKGLTLEANGKLTPAGEPYLNMVTEFGICAKPGDRVVLTDVKIEKNKIVFELNGGPDLKHRILRHVSLGTGPATTPVVQTGNEQPVGSRLTLEFKGHIPDLTGAQVKALLAPLISFDVKTPIQAFTDTLPGPLKQAILDHHVMVGMSTDMVLFALGQPQRKVRETQEQMPFEEWIYGAPPDPVQFVRINGNRVIRVEIAKVGEMPEIFTKDEVEGLMRTDGSPVIAVKEAGGQVVRMGDVQRNPDTQSAAPPPTLTAPGETLPDHAQTGAGAMKPVQFPTQKPDDYPDATNLPRDHKAAADDGDDDQPKPTATQSATSSQSAGQGGSSAPAQPAAAPSTTPPATDQPH